MIPTRTARARYLLSDNRTAVIERAVRVRICGRSAIPATEHSPDGTSPSPSRSLASPTARTFILGIFGIVAGLAAAHAPAAAQPEPGKAVATCPARVELAGDGAAMAQVGAELRALGVELGGPVAGCRSVGARVELGEHGGIAVAILDGARRSEGRVVGDAAVAAAWIDSWLRDDLDGSGWLVAIPRPRAVAVVPVAPAHAQVGPPGLVDPPGRIASRTSLASRVAFGAGYEQAWTDDGVGASGFTAAACVRVGGVCLGLRGRHAVEQERSLESTAMSRSDTEVLAIATASVGLGRMTFAPEIGLGLGWRDTARVECVPAQPTPPPGCPPNDPMCDPSDPNNNIPPDGSAPAVPGVPRACEDPTSMNKWYVGDGLSARTYTPRVSAGVRLAVPLADHVWLEGSAGASLAPFGHAAPFAPVGMFDPATGVDANQLALPGEPMLTFRLAVGLRVGAR